MKIRACLYGSIVHTFVVLTCIFVIFGSSYKLQPCENVSPNKIRLSGGSGDRWFKWARLYSFCNQYDTVTKGINTTGNHGCNSLECDQCLSVCYKEGRRENLTVCEKSCNTISCRNGCKFYTHVFGGTKFNFTSDANNTPNIIDADSIHVKPNIDTVDVSWPYISSRGAQKLSSIYLVTVSANKEKDREYILGLVRDPQYSVSMSDMCYNLYIGYRYTVDLAFAVTVYPINYNGPEDLMHAKKWKLSLKSEYHNPLQISSMENITVSTGSPYFENAVGKSYDVIKWKVEWPKLIVNGSKGVKYTYQIDSCYNKMHIIEMRKLNHRHNSEVSLDGPANVIIYNTKDDKLNTCIIAIEFWIKYDVCFLSKPYDMKIRYDGCKSVAGYRNQCPMPIPTAVPIDTLIYDINTTVIGPTCEEYFLIKCPDNTNLTCNHCNVTRYDITVHWKPLTTVYEVRNYRVRWGKMQPPMYILIDEGNETLVHPNTTTYLIPSIFISIDFLLGIQVHAETDFSISTWKYNIKSIHKQTLNVLKPVPVKQTLQNKLTKETSTTTVIIVIMLILICLSFVVLFVIYRYRENHKKGRIPNEEIRMDEKQVVADEWEIYPSSVTLDEKIGEGAFGNVYSASIDTDELIKSNYAKQCSGATLMTEKTKVAVKFLKDSAQDLEYNDFQEEILLMKEIGYHEHIVNLIGCSTLTKPLFLVIEFMYHGDLLHYLRKYRTNEKQNEACDAHAHTDVKTNDHVSPQDVMSFAWQIAGGMEYLSMHNVVHRDLAARNILISDERKVKISDFGLSRHVSEELIYISSNKTRKLPIKWMSIEAIYHQEFTTASDVWAYGVVLFEIVTLGGTPYPSIGNRELCTMLKSGYRMDKPDNCDDTIYLIMLHCWNEIPSQRPTFTELREHLEALVEKGDLYFTFDIDENETYYNVASFKSIPSNHDNEDEVFTKEYNERPIQIKATPVSKLQDDALRHGTKTGEIDSNRYFSPQSIKTFIDVEKFTSFDNPIFDYNSNDDICDVLKQD